MRRPRLERQPQGLAGAEQMLLPDHRIERGGTQLFRQRRMGERASVGEQVSVQEVIPAT
ncbi:MAG: hypothetical protein Q8L93_11520 [Rhodocyclaceae bacterium]|nr:hypothetical protein [Rhodocyclaceae bacterium]